MKNSRGPPPKDLLFDMGGGGGVNNLSLPRMIFFSNFYKITEYIYIQNGAHFGEHFSS